MGSMPYQQSLDKLGLTTLHATRERGDVINSYKILTGKVDVQPETWFTPLNSREGAASTRATSGYLNLERKQVGHWDRFMPVSYINIYISILLVCFYF